jgi:hypothetical protein
MVGEIPATSTEDLARMLAISDEAIDTSDIPERSGERQRLTRDENSQLPRRRSLIRESITAEMTVRAMTPYALWKAARQHCPTISETAVGDFLKGNRSVGLDYLEAMMTALEMTIGPTRR